MIFAPMIRRPAYRPALRPLDLHLERFLGQALQPAGAHYRLEQDEQGYTLQIDAPGLKREQIQIDLEGAVVRVQSVADAPRRLQLALELPQDLDLTHSQARLEDGVLTLKLGKRQADTQATRLTVQ